MKPERLYSVGRPVMCRVSSRSPDDFSAASAEAPNGADATDAELTHYIRLLMKDPVLREGVAVSSTSLFETAERIVDGFPVKRKKLLSSAVSLTRYMLRMTDRTTPFGLFASVTKVQVGPTGSAENGDADEKSVRLDSGWLHDMTMRWLKDGDTRHRVEVVFNNLCFERGTRLVLPFVRVGIGDQRATAAASRRAGEFSVRNTSLVSWIRSHTQEPVRYTDLLDETTEKFGADTRDRVDRVLAGLIEHELLLTSFAASPPDEAVLRRTWPERARVQEALDSYARRAPGNGVDRWREALSLIHSFDGDTSQPPIQVDLRSRLDITVPQEVLDEAESYAAAMWSITPERTKDTPWTEYRNAFLEKYGTDRPVPLHRLTDPHAGLGFPAGFKNPESHRSFSNGDAGPDEERTEKLAALLHTALASPSREALLTDQAVRDLSAGRPAPPATAMELSFQVLSRSLHDLNSGAFELLATPLAGSPTAGATSGRFAELTGSTKELVSLMAAASPGAITAHVVFLPRTPRCLNLVQVPPMAEHTIQVGAFHDSRDPSNIDWHELCVVDDGNRLRLYWQRTGQEVVPVLPHMLNVRDQAPNIARFLAEFRFSGEPKLWQPWNWTGLEHAPLLPRVRHGRTIVSPLQWRVGTGLRRAAVERGPWRHALEEWRESFHVPDRVNITVLDRVYGVDLDNAFHQEMLRREVSRNPDVRVTEDRNADRRAFGWSDGRSNEFVVPFLPSRPETTRTGKPFALPPQAEEEDPHLPGGEWVYAKLYSTAPVQNDILTTFLPPLIQEVSDVIDRWFFIRYQDPDPHLRIRFHGTQTELNQTVLPALFRHARAMRRAGVLRDLQLATYEPEYERYGGAGLMTAAERLFCVDSQSVLAQLQSSTAVPSEVLLVSNYAAILESLGEWDWHGWAAGLAFPDEAPVPVPRASIARTTALLTSGTAAGRLSETVGVSALTSLWTASPIPRAYGRAVLAAHDPHRGADARNTALLGLLHMHHNRLHGIDPRHERRTLALLAKTAHTITMEQRHGS